MTQRGGYMRKPGLVPALHNIGAGMVLGSLLTGCDPFGGYGADDDPPIPYQTEILDVVVTPDPVAVGDTVTLKAVIGDSLDERFWFEWGLPDLIPVDGSTIGPVVKWEAIPTSEVAGEIWSAGATVKADNGSPDSLPPVRAFEIPIKN